MRVRQIHPLLGGFQTKSFISTRDLNALHGRGREKGLQVHIFPKRTREFKNETSENGLTEDRRKLTFLLPHAL